MVLHRSGRAAGGLVTVAVVTAGLAASLGAGYTVAQATLQDSSAYVTKGTAVSHVNGESRRVDATSTGPVLAKNGDRVITRATPSGEVIAINQRTGAVTTIDRGTMSPTSSVTPKKPVIKAPDVVSSGSRSWLIDYDARAVRPMRNGVAVGGTDITGRPVDAAPGPDGSVLVLTREGKVFRVDADNKVTPIDVDEAERAALTVAGGRTYLVTATGGVVDVYGDGARKVATVPGVGPGPDGRMLAGSTQGAGTHVLIVSEAALAIVDPDTGSSGELVALGTGAHILGEPVEYRGRVYVPDFDQHKLVVVDVAAKAVANRPLDVPGTQRYFDLFVSGDKLWANDQYAQLLIQIDRAGEHQIDKGAGNGVKPDPKPTTTPPKTTPPIPGVTPPPTNDTGNSRSTASGGRNGKDKDNGSNGGNNGRGRDDGGATGDAKPELVAVPTFPDGTTVEDACGRLIELRLRCNQVSREDPAKESGAVLQTMPGAGAKVEVGGSVTVIFVGPAEVPTIAPGTQPIDACANAVTPAGLKCAYAPLATPADDRNSYGAVAGTSPAAGSRVSNGQTVTIQYYDSFVMPDFNGKEGTSSCNDVTALSLTLPDAAGKPQTAHPRCDAVSGKSVETNNQNAQGQVYDQQPTAGQVYQARSTVRLTYYSGDAELADYRGKELQPSLDDCGVHFACDKSGNTEPAVTDGQFRPELVGKIARQTNGNGTDVDPGTHKVGTNVSFVAYRGDNDIPDVTGKGVADACSTLANAGFACNMNKVPVGNYPANQVQSQGPTGHADMGTTVTVNYWDLNPVPLYKHSAGNIHWLTTNPTEPGSQVDEQFALVYPARSYSPPWQLFEQRCEPTNTFLYTHSANAIGTCVRPTGTGAFTQQGSKGALVPPDGATCNFGTRMVWRVFSGPANARVQDVLLHDGDPSPNSSEAIGCAYPFS